MTSLTCKFSHRVAARLLGTSFPLIPVRLFKATLHAPQGKQQRCHTDAINPQRWKQARPSLRTAEHHQPKTGHLFHHKPSRAEDTGDPPTLERKSNCGKLREFPDTGRGYVIPRLNATDVMQVALIPKLVNEARSTGKQKAWKLIHLLDTNVTKEYSLRL